MIILVTTNSSLLLVYTIDTHIVLLMDSYLLTTLENPVFNVTLFDEDGNRLNGMDIELFIDGVSIGTFKTDINGNIYVNHRDTFLHGFYTVTAVFAGSGVYWPSNAISLFEVRRISTTLTIHRVSSASDSMTLFVATLTDEYGKIVTSRIISFELNGEFIGIAITD